MGTGAVCRNPCPDRMERRLAPEPRTGRARRNLRPRPRGSGETVSTSEPLGGRARRDLRPRPRGADESWFVPEARESGDLGFVPWRLWLVRFVLCVSYCSNSGILFMVPNNSPASQTYTNRIKSPKGKQRKRRCQLAYCQLPLAPFCVS